jgi:hypothetical protein
MTEQLKNYVEKNIIMKVVVVLQFIHEGVLLVQGHLTENML